MGKCRLKDIRVESCMVWHHFLCLPCSWPLWCGMGSHPGPHTSLCCSSLGLRQPAQGCQGWPAGTRCVNNQHNRYRQQTDKTTHNDAASTHRFRLSVDGQQVGHPVVEAAGKVVWVDGHETLTLRAATQLNTTHCYFWGAIINKKVAFYLKLVFPLFFRDPAGEIRKEQHTRLATRSVTFQVRMLLLYWAPARIPQKTSTIMPRP